MLFATCHASLPGHERTASLTLHTNKHKRALQKKLNSLHKQQE